MTETLSGLSSEIPPEKAVKKGRIGLTLSYLLEPYLYLSPALILISLVILVPLAIGISYSFQSISLLQPFKTGWVGLDNYRDLLSDTKFLVAAKKHILVDDLLRNPAVSAGTRASNAAQHALSRKEDCSGLGVSALGGANLAYSAYVGLVV